MAERSAGRPSKSVERREETHEPTPNEVMQVGVAGAEAVKPEEQSPEQAREAVETAVTEKAQELRITLDPQAISAIADGTIAELERRGAFQQPEEASPPTETSNEQETPERGAETATEPPHKRTLAEKLLGGN